MQNITPTMQTILINPTSCATATVFSETIPTGAPGRTLKGIEVINGGTASDTTALIIYVYRTSASAANLLGTVTWSATQAAYTGVYTAIEPLESMPSTNDYDPIATLPNYFDEGDVLLLYGGATDATSATVGYVTLFWE